MNTKKTKMRITVALYALLSFSLVQMFISCGGNEPEEVTYTVKFESNGGTAISNQIVKENEKVEEPAAPEKDGYTFDDWYTDEACTNAYNFDQTVTGNLTLYAKWNEVKADDKTEKDKETPAEKKEPEKKETTEEKETENTEEPSGTGESSEPSETPDPEPVNPNPVTPDPVTPDPVTPDPVTPDPVTPDPVTPDPVTPEPVKTFTVTFETFGGVTESGANIPAQTINNGEKAQAPAAIYLKNCTFDKWYTDINYTNEFDFTSSVTESITLYAKWNFDDSEKHLVRFVTNGGSLIPAQLVEDGNSINLQSEPTKEHYIFDGWYTDSKFYNEYTFNPVKQDIVLYAKWQPMPCLITVVSSDVSVTRTVDSNGVIHFESNMYGSWNIDDEQIDEGKFFNFNPADYLKGTYELYFTTHIYPDEPYYSYTALIKVQ